MDDLRRQTLRYVEETPGFREAVEQAKKDRPKRPVLTVSLSIFHDDPMRLYAGVLYATTSGVSLTFAP